MIKLKKIINEIITNSPPPAMVQSQPAITNQNSGLNPKDIQMAHLLAATIWGEARNEGETGMHAVLNVIMNRANQNIAKASTIVLKPKQFSFWNNITNPNEYATNLSKKYSQASPKLPDVESYNKAIKLVDAAIQHKLPDITGGAQFYFNPSIVRPEWAKTMIKTKTIGHHEFYKAK